MFLYENIWLVHGFVVNEKSRPASCKTSDDVFFPSSAIWSYKSQKQIGLFCVCKNNPEYFVRFTQVLCKDTLKLTVTPNITLMSELPVMDTLQGHPFDGHLPGTSKAHHMHIHYNEQAIIPFSLTSQMKLIRTLKTQILSSN